jgi:uncharacterized membrane protein YdjX (TVP38/TMEM64 family)
VITKLRVFEAIDRSLEAEGIKLILLLRLQPIIPWNILNYILAVTSCSIQNFLIGTFIGILPGTLTFIYIGVNLKEISEIITGKRKADRV